MHIVENEFRRTACSNRGFFETWIAEADIVQAFVRNARSGCSYVGRHRSRWLTVFASGGMVFCLVDGVFFILSMADPSEQLFI